MFSIKLSCFVMSSVSFVLSALVGSSRRRAGSRSAELGGKELDLLLDRGPGGDGLFDMEMSSCLKARARLELRLATKRRPIGLHGLRRFFAAPIELGIRRL